MIKMGRKYNKPYKKGKYLSSKPFGKSWLADKSKTAKNTLRNIPSNRRIWARDTRKYDLWGIDTRPPDTRNIFRYRSRSKKRLGKKIGRENRTYRKYYRRK